MDLSKEASLVFQNAIAYANKYKYEYVTPEMILLMILDDDVFAEAFEECGVEFYSKHQVRTQKPDQNSLQSHKKRP